MPTWIVRVRGELTSEVVAGLENAGITPTGFSHSTSSGGPPTPESSSLFIDAADAEDAMERLRVAVAELPVSVEEETPPRPVETD